MGREQTFLKRLAEGAGPGRARPHEPTTVENVEALKESVREHLIRLLNARHDMSQAAPDYGLPSLVDLTVNTREHVPAMQRAIRTTIEKYEPRLRHVRVSHVPVESASTARSLLFRVDAVLVGREGEHKVGYVTSVRQDGQFEVAD